MNNFISGIVQAFIGSAISLLGKLWYDRKMNQKVKLNDLLDICRKYQQQANMLHREARENIYSSAQNINITNSINKTRAMDFKEQIFDDVKLNKLLNDLSINRFEFDEINNKFKAIDADNIYDFFNYIQGVLNNIQQNIK